VRRDGEAGEDSMESSLKGGTKASWPKLSLDGHLYYLFVPLSRLRDHAVVKVSHKTITTIAQKGRVHEKQWDLWTACGQYVNYLCMVYRNELSWTNRSRTLFCAREAARLANYLPPTLQPWAWSQSVARCTLSEQKASPSNEYEHKIWTSFEEMKNP